MPAPELVLLDVNETLSDMRPLAQRFVDVGAPAHLSATWFAATLRDGFALAVTERAAPFPQVALGVLHALLGPLELTVPVADAAQHVLDGFPTLQVHGDVAAGLRRLASADVRLVSFSNGSASVADALLDGAGLADLVPTRLSVDDAGRWKPHAEAYRWALDRCGVAPGDAAMVAVHPWDLAGAAAVGMRTGWLDRAGTRAPSAWPAVFPEPDARGRDLTELAGQLLAG